jgi:ferredoxin
MTEITNKIFDVTSPYRRLARTLDALPNRFPPAEDESELRLLAKIFTVEEADLTACLLPVLETPAEIAKRLGRDVKDVMVLLKDMSKKGLILVGKTELGRLGFGLMPFVVGIYEAQIGRIDAEMAQLFEIYYHEAFQKSLKIHPQVHRVIPVGESIKNDMEVHPFESVSNLLDDAKSWGVVDCICRTQKALIGDPCSHPLDVCMVLSQNDDAFANNSTIRALNRDEAASTLKRAADAGLVHCVSNQQSELWYICNCCTCSCSILRGMADLGLANVVARSAFVSRVNANQCIACGICVDACQFDALLLEDVVRVLEMRCVGCGVCVPLCSQKALVLERRPAAELPPVTEKDWQAARVSL